MCRRCHVETTLIQIVSLVQDCLNTVNSLSSMGVGDELGDVAFATSAFPLGWLCLGLDFRFDWSELTQIDITSM